MQEQEKKHANEENVRNWLDSINLIADEKAQELSVLLDCEVTPSVYVIEELKDAAIAYIKKPDAKQSFKILRTLGENYENGLELAAKSQLIRVADLTIKQIEGEASDARFMDVNGVYDKKHSDLNLSLMFKMQTLVRPFSDQFKKK